MQADVSDDSAVLGMDAETEGDNDLLTDEILQWGSLVPLLPLCPSLFPLPSLATAHASFLAPLRSDPSTTPSKLQFLRSSPTTLSSVSLFYAVSLPSIVPSSHKVNAGIK